MTSYKTTNTLIIGLMVLCFWLVILFLDGSFSSSLLTTSVTSLPSLTTGTQSPSSYTVSAPVFSEENNSQSLTSFVLESSLTNTQSFQDLTLLEFLYKKNNNPELLQPLIEKFLQYYQFDKANEYLKVLLKDNNDYFTTSLDPRQILYALFHDSDIEIDSPYALNDIFTLVNEYKKTEKLTTDDVLFYQGLKYLWLDDYTGATSSFSKITDPRYQSFCSSYESALANFVKIKNPPEYYRDGLVSLTLLKHGYFVFAKKLALRSLLKNTSYILPYQVLAYTNFLTHHRESSIEYFLKLADFDTVNSSLYKFLIGVSYYRYGDYEQSILYLSQVDDPTLKTDVYRYMLLGYIAGEDQENVLRMWQNLLGGTDLVPSDFSTFFSHVFYLPFASGKPFDFYQQNPQLAVLYHTKCVSLFTGSQADVCTYGEVGLQLAQQNLSGAYSSLLLLSQTYHQSVLYHLLGDYYGSIHNNAFAKEYYVKALSLCTTIDEQHLLTNKINTLDSTK